MSNSGFVTTAECNQLLNTAGARLHDLLVNVFDDYRVRASAAVVLQAGRAYYDFVTDFAVSDFYKLLGCYLTASGSGALPQILSRCRYNEIGGNNSTPRYAVMGNGVWLNFLPTASSGSIQLLYVPQYADLVADADTLYSAPVAGWDEYVINDAAINIRLKEESDISGLLARQQQFEQHVISCAKSRDAGQAWTVTDVSAQEDGYSCLLR